MATPTPKLAIVTALAEEMQGVSLRFPELSAKGGWSVRLPNPDVPVITGVCGLLARNLPSMLEQLRLHFPAVKDLILLGCCGALVRDLRPFDCRCALGHVSTDGTERIPTDDRLTALLAGYVDSAPAWFATSDTVLTDGAQKRECARLTGAEVVEMEGLFLARACRDAGLRFGSVRWVLDGLEDDIPQQETPENAQSWEMLRERLERIGETVAASLPAISRLRQTGRFPK